MRSRQVTYLEEKMKSDVLTILQLVRQSKLQQQAAASQASIGADVADSSGDTPFSQSAHRSQVAFPLNLL